MFSSVEAVCLNKTFCLKYKFAEAYRFAKPITVVHEFVSHWSFSNSVQNVQNVLDDMVERINEMMYSGVNILSIIECSLCSMYWNTF